MKRPETMRCTRVLRQRKGEKEMQAEKREKNRGERERRNVGRAGGSRACVYVCASGTRRRRDSVGQAGRTCVFVFG